MWLIPLIIGAVKAFFGMKTAQAQTAAEVENNRVNAQASVQVSEGHSPINAIVRATFAAPVALYYGKLFLWDKVLGWGATDPLSPDLIHVSWVIIGFYFLTTIRG